MSAATEWMTDQRRRSSYRSYLSDIDLQLTPPEPASTATLSVPGWQSKVLDRLRDLMNLKHDWDSYGANPPSVTSAVELINVLASVMAVNTPAPSIVPSPLGHFQAEWHRNGADLEVEVISPTRIVVSFSDATSSWDREINVDFTPLIQAVRRIGGT